MFDTAIQHKRCSGRLRVATSDSDRLWALCGGVGPAQVLVPRTVPSELASIPDSESHSAIMMHAGGGGLGIAARTCAQKLEFFSLTTPCTIPRRLPLAYRVSPPFVEVSLQQSDATLSCRRVEATESGACETTAGRDWQGCWELPSGQRLMPRPKARSWAKGLGGVQGQWVVIARTRRCASMSSQLLESCGSFWRGLQVASFSDF
jgi:hypothetical protein